MWLDTSNQRLHIRDGTYTFSCRNQTGTLQSYTCSDLLTWKGFSSCLCAYVNHACILHTAQWHRCGGVCPWATLDGTLSYLCGVIVASISSIHPYHLSSHIATHASSLTCLPTSDQPLLINHMARDRGVCGDGLLVICAGTLDRDPSMNVTFNSFVSAFFYAPATAKRQSSTHHQRRYSFLFYEKWAI
jgi:hypothetical protein